MDQKSHNPPQRGKTACGHRLCEQCVDMLLDKEKSPQCPVGEEDCVILSRTDQTIFPDYSGRKDLKKLKVYCSFKDNGCKETMTWANWEKHMSNCEFAVEYCPFHSYGCEETGRREHIKTHSKSCQYIPIYQYFNEKFAVNKMDEHHKKICRQYTVECPNGCGPTGIKLKDNHTKNCQYDLAICPHCNNWISRKELQEHLISCPTAKIRKEDVQRLAKATHQQHRQIKKLKKKFMHLKNDNEDIKKKVTHVTNISAFVDSGIHILSSSLENIQKDVEAQREETLDLAEKVPGDKLQEMQLNLEELRSRLLLIESASLPAPRHQPGHQELTLNQLSHIEIIKTQKKTCLARIHPYNELKLTACEEKRDCLSSEEFYYSEPGYCFKVLAYLNGKGSCKNTHLSMALQNVQGQYDTDLSWPFCGKLTFKLCNCEEKYDIEQCRMFKYNSTSDETQLLEEFCLQSTLESEDNGFIIENSISVEIILDLQVFDVFM